MGNNGLADSCIDTGLCVPVIKNRMSMDFTYSTGFVIRQ